MAATAGAPPRALRPKGYGGEKHRERVGLRSSRTRSRTFL